LETVPESRIFARAAGADSRGFQIACVNGTTARFVDTGCARPVTRSAGGALRQRACRMDGKSTIDKQGRLCVTKTAPIPRRKMICTVKSAAPVRASRTPSRTACTNQQIHPSVESTSARRWSKGLITFARAWIMAMFAGSTGRQEIDLVSFLAASPTPRRASRRWQPSPGSDKRLSTLPKFS